MKIYLAGATGLARREDMVLRTTFNRLLTFYYARDPNDGSKHLYAIAEMRKIKNENQNKRNIHKYRRRS